MGSLIPLSNIYQTVSAIYAFFLAITMFPEAARKAQAELDSVIGHDRLPTFSDRPNLPYVNALVSEVLRWHTVVPTGSSSPQLVSCEMADNNSAVPHRVTQDDVHDGYFIPKGALIIPNIWSVTRAPARHVLNLHGQEILP